MKPVNVQVLGGTSPWTRPSAPGCGDTLKAFVSFGLILGGNHPHKRVDPGSLPTGSPAGRAPLERRLNVQSGLRKGDKGPAQRENPSERSRP